MRVVDVTAEEGEMTKREDGEQLSVGVWEIDVVEGHNPRTYFDERGMRDLEESIKAQGVLQTLLVRKGEDGRFQLIAGERRLRAARKVLGATGQVPVMVRQCGDAEMQAMAIIENTSQEAMGPANESEGAHKLMMLLKGDKTEVAMQLGWTMSKLERRLALMRSTQEVRNALTEKKISLGHAELLAAVPGEKQNSALKTIIDRNLSVTMLRKEIGKIANALEDAVFDKTECATCQYSSAQQNSLFTESIAAGYCTNSGCWDLKTDTHLESVAEKLREDVPKVEVLKADGSFEPIKLVAEGPMGVGSEQAKSCRGCMNFGCTVSGLPGTVGQVEKSICFDSECHSDKVSAQLKVAQAAAEAGKKAAASVRAQGGNEGSAKEAEKEANKKVRDAAGDKASTGAVSTRLKEYRTRVWRQTASRAAFASPDKSRDLLITLALSGHTRHIDQGKVGEALDKLAGKKLGVGRTVNEVGGTVAELSEKVKATMVNALAASAMANVEERDLTGSLKFMGVELENYWGMNEEFLGLLTKSEIFAVCNEVGIVGAMGKDKFKAAMGGKKDEFVKAVLSVKGFAYKGVVPKTMRWDVEVSGVEVNDVGDEEEDKQSELTD
jgi:ParB family chromosome partitioning protein